MGHAWDMLPKTLISKAILQIQEPFATVTHEQIQILRTIPELDLVGNAIPGQDPTPSKLPALADCILLVIRVT